MEQRASAAECIARLSSSQATEREEAARELFRQGCAAAEPALRHWFANPEFRGLLRAGKPLLTVGIAVTPAHFEQIRASCGQPRLAEMPPGQDASEFEIEFAHGVRIDVLTTLNVRRRRRHRAFPGALRRRNTAGGMQCCSTFGEPPKFYAITLALSR